MDGFLYKKSKHVDCWKKRSCKAQSSGNNGFLEICYKNEKKSNLIFNLLLCSIKTIDGEHLCFDVVSPNETIHLKAENEDDFKHWVSVLRNIKNQCLENTFKAYLATCSNA